MGEGYLVCRGGAGAQGGSEVTEELRGEVMVLPWRWRVGCHGDDLQVERTFSFFSSEQLLQLDVSRLHVSQ